MDLRIFFFVSGLCVGSFLNAVIYRLKTGEGIARKRSHCPRCGHKLGLWDLVPVFSFVFLGGRCHYCRKKIPWQYPAVELISGLLFLFIWIKFSSNILLTIHYFLLTSFLIVIFVYDLRHYIIPDIVVYPGIFLTLVYRTIEAFDCGLSIASYDLLSFIFSALGAAGFFFIIYLASRGQWLGFGDVKLAFLMGIALGFPAVFVAIFAASFVGSIVGTGLVIAGRKGWKSEVPFAPFLVTGTFIGLFWGGPIVSFYLKFWEFVI